MTALGQTGLQSKALVEGRTAFEADYTCVKTHLQKLSYFVRYALVGYAGLRGILLFNCCE